MSSVTAHDRPFAGWHGGWLRFLRNALASTNRREASYAFLIGLLIAAVNCTWLFESMEKPTGFDKVLTSALMPLLVSPFALAAWVIADRADGARLPRGWRIALCVAVSVGVAALIIPTLIELVGLPWRRWLDEKPEFAKIPDWAMRFEFWLRASIYTGLALGVFEMSQRRANSQRALEAVRREQVALARQLLESRLAAMQAQVEPQFLFDSLVDVQATYDRDGLRGADVMDRLITYLRVALPRLRETGSTMQAEVELVAAYLAVVTARHGGLPVAHLTVAPDCAGARFYPMLLLPLVQRAIRSAAGQVPARIELTAKNAGGRLVAVLRIAASGLCTDDTELTRVRQRLDGLYDGRAQLECSEAAGTTQFTLSVPS